MYIISEYPPPPWEFNPIIYMHAGSNIILNTRVVWVASSVLGVVQITCLMNTFLFKLNAVKCLLHFKENQVHNDF